ncbi:hypothetical protein SCHPADRAFT_903242 [Schizopora paradoxa]|uniref:S-adenosyl-L-methionine-dependent methyltransferase n=1 Tax=Schizopora paradoxa TaxID=27342 RepID=A0A0H2RRU3_9AGAM|nr:hypothetical protein SCHPADRAFT_903242 [Schizopora paradoxa]
MDEILPQAPTSALPSIKELRFSSLARLQNAVDYLHLLYLPEVRGSQRRRKTRRKDIGLRPSCQTSTRASDIQSIRSDAFERAFSLRWLTALNKVLTENYGNLCDDSTQDVSDAIASSDDERQKLIDRAASLLASCSGASATGIISRCFKFSPLGDQNNSPISVLLTDVPLINADYGTVGAQTWGGACVLSEMLVEDPGSFGLVPPSEILQSQHTLRILELGSGTGLVGLSISKLFTQISTSSFAASDPEVVESLSSIRKVEIVLTDFHPVVLENLRRNVEANVASSNGQAGGSRLEVDVRVRRLDWEAVYRAGKGDSSGVNEGEGQGAADMKVDQRFDLIYGADIIYEEHHAVWIRACLEKLLARTPSAAFHLIIPLRSTHAEESSTIARTFPRSSSSTMSSNPSPDCPSDIEEQAASANDNSGRHLVVKSEEKIICDALPDNAAGKAAYDGADEVVYVYYKIGWEDLPSKRFLQ